MSTFSPHQLFVRQSLDYAYSFSDLWYLSSNQKPDVWDVWNDASIPGKFVNCLLNQGMIGVASDLIGCLCLILDNLGIAYQVYSPKYECCMGEFMPIANFSMVTLV